MAGSPQRSPTPACATVGCGPVSAPSKPCPAAPLFAAWCGHGCCSEHRASTQLALFSSILARLPPLLSFTETSSQYSSYPSPRKHCPIFLSHFILVLTNNTQKQATLAVLLSLQTCLCCLAAPASPLWLGGLPWLRAAHSVSRACLPVSIACGACTPCVTPCTPSWRRRLAVSSRYPPALLGTSYSARTPTCYPVRNAAQTPPPISSHCPPATASTLLPTRTTCPLTCHSRTTPHILNVSLILVNSRLPAALRACLRTAPALHSSELPRSR